ncbi:beta-propeller domain-containing protein, partial [Candidatus Woesearchaeota archaeon]|nr:beta-propeller domain-containing protein [Candidatus Woesearchaeota archaeon]
NDVVNQEENIERTIIHKFNLDDGNIKYLGKMNAPGTVLNQFSMDEFDGNFRIATTINKWDNFGKNKSKNNIYIFNEDLKLIGSLEDLAPGETIYSARFMGKRGYLVTFKKVDPFFVIDLGKLKIPGFSDYLHPYDENHIIGIGKEAVEAKQGDFAWYQGMKLAIFDVSDVNNPVELHKITIGDRGTDSEALHEHKAFLFDREKQLLVIPITLAEIKEKKDNEQKPVWQIMESTLSKGLMFIE